MMRLKELRGSILLLIAAFVWGIAFVAQSAGAELVGPFTFLCLRSFLGAAVLLPLIAFRSRRSKTVNEPAKAENGKALLIGCVLCGVALCVASYLQQAGIAILQQGVTEADDAVKEAVSGKAGFITTMYILIVPILGLFFKKKVSPRLWFCIGLGVVALYLLSVKDGFTVAVGDILLMLCAVVFSVHILVIDHFSPKVDGVKLACLQFFVVGLLSLLPMLLIEKPSFDAIKAAWLPIAYAGVFSSGVGYTLQIIGQKYTRPTLASLIMSFESVFAVLAGVLVGQLPTGREWGGCALMFVAVILAQLPKRK